GPAGRPRDLGNGHAQGGARREARLSLAAQVGGRRRPPGSAVLRGRARHGGRGLRAAAARPPRPSAFLVGLVIKGGLPELTRGGPVAALGSSTARPERGKALGPAQGLRAEPRPAGLFQAARSPWA